MSSCPGGVMEVDVKVGVVGYRKTEGFATIHGQMFEVKLAALLFLRATDRALDFQLAVNVDGAGALDDVVIKYKAPGVDQPWHTGFIQLKHKEGANLKVEMFTAPGGNFSLKKYLSSYLKIQSAMSAVKKQEIFNGLLDNCHLAIYTNAKSDSKLQNRSFVRDDDDFGGFQSLIKSGLETEMIFSFHSEHDADVAVSLADVDGASSDAVAEFLSRLKVFCGQPSEPELDALLGAEVASLMRRSKLLHGRQLPKEDVVDIVDKLVQEFHTWWSVKQNAHVLDQRSNIVSQILVQFLSTEAKKSHRINVKFNATCLHMLTFIDSLSLLSVVTSKANFKLSCTKILQAFHAEEMPGKATSCIFLAMERYLADEATVTSVWTQEDRDCLCIVRGTSEPTPPGFHERLCEALKKYPTKKCVLLSVESDANVATFCAAKLGDRFKEITDKICLSHLDDDCRIAFLDRALDWQGHSTKISNLLEGTDISSMLIDDEMVEEVLVGDSISIGQDMDAFTSEFSFYIPRTLQRNDVVVPDFLSSQTSGCILLTGTTAEGVAGLLPRPAEPDPEELRDLEPGCVIRTSLEKPSQDQLDGFCRNDRIAHWFHRSPTGALQWIWSLRGAPLEDGGKTATPSGSLFRKHLQTGEYSTESVDVAGRVVLVVAEPGMGKTTLLNHLALQAKRDNPDRLVVRVNLSDHTKLLAGWKSEKTNATDFLMAAVGVAGKSSLEKSLFKLCLESSGNASVLLDGFDEIAPSYSEQGCALITGLLKTKVHRVWVTSRHSMRDLLESHLSTIAFHLLPFSPADQKAFVKTFWQKSPGGTHGFEDAALDARIEEFLAAVTVSMNDGERQFMGVPLQTMMMAEAFQDIALSLETAMVVQDRLIILDLFERFVEKKLAVYANKVFSSSLANNEGAMDDIREMFIKNHMHASLLLLLTEADFGTLKARDKIVKKATKFLQKIQDGKDKTGIIHSVTNGQPHFVHRTFAEYFTALWLSTHFDDARDLIDSRLYGANFQVVRTLFDRLLAKGCKLHNAVLANNWPEFEALIDAGFELNACDKGGRTPLHLAAAVGFNSDMNYFKGTVATHIKQERHRLHEGPRPLHFVESLLTLKDVDIGVIDKVLGLSPLQLAFKTESWDAVEILLQVDKEVGTIMRSAVDALLASVNLSSKELEHANLTKLFIMMCDVSAYGFINFVTKLLSLGVPVDFLIRYNYSTTSDCSTMITVAATFGQIEIVELLINKDANFTKHIGGTNAFPLHLACLRGHTAVVKALVCAVADDVQRHEFINSKDKWGQEVISYVVVCMRTDILGFLISQGVDITCRRGRSTQGTALHSACVVHGQLLPIVKTLVESFGDDEDGKFEYINTIDNHGRSALHFAATKGLSLIVDYLISHGAEVDCTSLHNACENGHLAVVQSLVRSFGNDTKAKLKFINSFHWSKKSAIYIAAEKDFFPIVEFLVNEGGDVFHAEREYDSPLIIAAKEGRTSVVNVLMKLFDQDEVARKAYIDSRNVQGHTSVSTAAYHKHMHIADFLIRKGGDARAKDIGTLQAALQDSCDEGDFAAVKAIVSRLINDKATLLETINVVLPRLLWFSKIENQKEFLAIAEYLILIGIDSEPNVPMLYSYMDHACKSDLISVARALLDRFGDDLQAKLSFIRQVDKDGQSVLDKALHYEEMIAFLFSEGALLRSSDLRSLWSPLHNACRKGHLLAVKKLLLCLGDDVDAVLEYINHASVSGHTALYDAACHGHAEIVEYLISRGAELTKYNPGSKKTALHEACLEGHLAVVEVIVNSFGENEVAKMSFINALDYCGECALYAAASKGKAGVVAFLARQYDDLSVAPVNASTQHSALHEACDEGHEGVVTAILDSFPEDRHVQKREYINRLNARGFSAVYIAAYKEHDRIVNLLVLHGGDPSVQEQGARDIAFHNACDQGHTAKVREILTSCGDDIDGKLQLLNSYNIYDCSDLPTPLHLAAWSGHADIIALLISEGCDLRSRRSGDRLYSFHRACFKGHFAAVRAIVDSFDDDLQSRSEFINSCDDFGHSALFITAYEGDDLLTEYLTNQGGDVAVCDKARKQVALHDAAKVGLLPKVKQALDGMAHDPRLKQEVINSLDLDGRTALMVAARGEYVSVVKLLVEEGSDLLGRETSWGTTVMHEAIDGGSVEVLNAILDGLGDDRVARAKLINRLDKSGQSELYYAFRHLLHSYHVTRPALLRTVPLIAFLRAQGGDVNAT